MIFIFHCQCSHTGICYGTGSGLLVFSLFKVFHFHLALKTQYFFLLAVAFSLALAMALALAMDNILHFG